MANFKPRTTEQKRAQSLRMIKHYQTKKLKLKRLKRFKNFLIFGIITTGTLAGASLSIAIVNINKITKQLKTVKLINKNRGQLIYISNYIMLNGGSYKHYKLNYDFWLYASFENFKKYINKLVREIEKIKDKLKKVKPTNKNTGQLIYSLNYIMLNGGDSKHYELNYDFWLYASFENFKKYVNKLERKIEKNKAPITPAFLTKTINTITKNIKDSLNKKQGDK